MELITLASLPKLTRIQLAARICVDKAWPDIGQLADPNSTDPITRDWLVNHLPPEHSVYDKEPSELLIEELARRNVKLDKVIYALDQVGRNDVAKWLHDRIERGFTSNLGPLLPETKRTLIKISDKIDTVKNLIQSAPHVVAIHGKKDIGKSLLVEVRFNQNNNILFFCLKLTTSEEICTKCWLRLRSVARLQREINER